MSSLALLFSALAGLVAIIIVYRALMVTRDWRVHRQHPGAIFLSCVGGSSLEEVVDDALLSGAWPTAPTGIPLFFTFVADDYGLSIFGFSRSAYLAVEWGRVVSVTPTSIVDGFRSSRGIEVRIRGDTAEVGLPIIVLGGGLFGAFPKSRKSIEKLCTQMDDHRRASADP